jgi:hypothetical protein
MEKYNDQTRRILENIFATTDKPQLKNPDNWIRKMTNLVGGTHYQHAHADQLWPFELEGEKTFPFVATHGFGVHPFEMWLLPKSQRGKQVRYIAQFFTYSAITYAWGFRACRRRDVATALPHEILPSRVSRTSVRSQRQLITGYYRISKRTFHKKQLQAL